MQTFLPFPDIQASVHVLDDKRLGKQRVEAKQILNVIEGRTTSWGNHPAVTMWEDNIEALALYHNACIEEWVHRGFNNTMEMVVVNYDDLVFPWWWGVEQLHWSHQSNLLRKDLMYYSEFFPELEDNWLYLWPNETKEDGFRTVIPKWAKDTLYINPLTLIKNE